MQRNGAILLMPRQHRGLQLRAPQLMMTGETLQRLRPMPLLWLQPALLVQPQARQQRQVTPFVQADSCLSTMPLWTWTWRYFFEDV